jgi:peptide-methionine (S)-S-oxide reductase
MTQNPNVANAVINVNNTDLQEVAILGAGCFWCVETIFNELKGVNKAISGYSGGTAETADYETVCTKTTNHIEVILVDFDPGVITYEEILQIFYSVHNPTTPNRQGNDVGPQYQSAIFYTDDRQMEIAEKVTAEFAPTLWDDLIITEIHHMDTFYPGEDYQQNYFNKVGNRNPYCAAVVAPKIAKFRKSFAHRLK